MINLLPIVVCTVFVLLALWHFYMAFAPASGESGAVPSIDGKPLFAPSRTATLAVGIVLLLFASLMAATAEILATGLPEPLLTWLSYALALGLLARAIGDFKYVGFFKRVRESRFAGLDTRIYSPLCLLLAGGVGTIAIQHAA